MADGDVGAKRKGMNASSSSAFGSSFSVSLLLPLFFWIFSCQSPSLSPAFRPPLFGPPPPRPRSMAHLAGSASVSVVSGRRCRSVVFLYHLFFSGPLRSRCSRWSLWPCQFLPDAPAAISLLKSFLVHFSCCLSFVAAVPSRLRFTGRPRRSYKYIL